MQTTKEVIAAKLKQLRTERAKNRILRAKQQVEPRKDGMTAQYLDNYLNMPDITRPPYLSPITPVTYSDPPPTPSVTRNPETLRALAILYPIRQHSTFGHWYIVSPEFYIEASCEFRPEWNENVQRISAVLTHSANLLVFISKVLRRDLPYRITFEHNKVLIWNQTTSYDLLSLAHQREFFIALKLLNGDANFFGNKGPNLLLPNLHAALQINESGSSSGSHTGMSSRAEKM
ncbi:hypothetical protein TRFO_37626 [Tritrichomonas foetus]|uniref:Uncharacterized protein n=1 Tax=Tritrichomonas foetus TaxID=1144522 RepID=A0A1J4JAR0_9EUKA|nr:hypothetical protein TRFO_37626 [Tritrichomonas foetus]|eukprot:OHS96240.1 hypothetical protein TRFO_37626 [Tritrichomonas foetus]